MKNFSIVLFSIFLLFLIGIVLLAVYLPSNTLDVSPSPRPTPTPTPTPTSSPMGETLVDN